MASLPLADAATMTASHRMAFFRGRAMLLAAGCTLFFLAPSAARAQDSRNLTGRWVLNRSQSQLDKEVGFNPAWLPARPRGDRESGGEGGRGRRAPGGGQQG